MIEVQNAGKIRVDPPTRPDRLGVKWIREWFVGRRRQTLNCPARHFMQAKVTPRQRGVPLRRTAILQIHVATSAARPHDKGLRGRPVERWPLTVSSWLPANEQQ